MCSQQDATINDLKLNLELIKEERHSETELLEARTKEVHFKIEN
jgi:hypothetical protein